MLLIREEPNPLYFFFGLASFTRLRNRQVRRSRTSLVFASFTEEESETERTQHLHLAYRQREWNTFATSRVVEQCWRCSMIKATTSFSRRTSSPQVRTALPLWLLSQTSWFSHFASLLSLQLVTKIKILFIRANYINNSYIFLNYI